MKKIAALIMTTAVLFSCIKDRQTGNDLVVGSSIPDFSVLMNDGTFMSGESLRNGVSCIVFFYTGCPDCQKTLPAVQRIYEEYSSRGVSFALISREETDETIRPYWQSNGYTMPYSAQSDRTIYELFAKTRVPRVYVCQNGVIKQIFTDTPAPPSYEEIKTSLEELL
jgi:peroxiredoxin